MITLRPKNDGFTLVELIVTIAITGMLVTGVTSLFITIEPPSARLDCWKPPPGRARKR